MMEAKDQMNKVTCFLKGRGFSTNSQFLDPTWSHDHLSVRLLEEGHCHFGTGCTASFQPASFGSSDFITIHLPFFTWKTLSHKGISQYEDTMSTQWVSHLLFELLFMTMYSSSSDVRLIYTLSRLLSCRFQRIEGVMKQHVQALWTETT